MFNDHRLLRSLVAVLGLALLGSTAVHAQTVSNFTGNIDGTEPQSYEVDDSTCTVVEPLLHYYEQYPMYVTESGSYDYTDLSIVYALDMQLTIYETSYDPNDVLVNCVSRLDDSGTFSLTAGQQYVFVVQPLFDSSFNTGDWEFDMTGPGEVIQGSAVPALSVPATSLWSLLTLVFLSLVLGAWGVLRR